MFSQATRSLLRAAPIARSPLTTCARTAFSTSSANSLISRMSQMSLARPVASPTKSLVAFQQTRGMKVRSSVKKLCDGCKVRTLRQKCWNQEEEDWTQRTVLMINHRVCAERAVNTSTSSAARTPSTSRGMAFANLERRKMVTNILQTRLIERREERLHCTTTGIPFSAYLVVAFQMDHYDFFPPHLHLYTVPCHVNAVTLR